MWVCMRARVCVYVCLREYARLCRCVCALLSLKVFFWFSFVLIFLRVPKEIADNFVCDWKFLDDRDNLNRMKKYKFYSLLYFFETYTKGKNEYFIRSLTALVVVVVCTLSFFSIYVVFFFFLYVLILIE